MGTFPHPDERSTLLFYAPTIRFPENQSDWLNPRKSPLNPFWDVHSQTRRSYTYGHFPLYLLVFSSNLLTDLTPTVEKLGVSPETVDFFRSASTGHGYAVVGRALVALLDTLSIYLLFLIARRLYGPWAGLLAAAFSAFAVLHIQLAHFFAVDPVSTTFVLLTVYGSMLMFDRRSIASAALTGVAIGLAVSSKYSALPVVLVPAVATWLAVTRRWEDRETGGQGDVEEKILPLSPSPPLPSTPYHPATLLIIAAAVSFITFALTSPFVLLDFDNFYQAVVKEQGEMVSGAADFPFTRQYRNTLPYIYFIKQQIQWGLWWPLGLLSLAGTIWVLARIFVGKLQAGEWLILAWLVPYFGFTGLFLAKFMRYMSPVTPFAIIFGVGLLVFIARRFSRSVAAVTGVIVLLATMLWAAMFVKGVYATEHSWVTASRWIYQNAPKGACIAVEHWEESLPRDWAWLEPGMSPGMHGYRQPQLPMYDPDTEQKFTTIRDTLRSCDFLVIASNRMYRTLPRLKERYPMSTRYYQALFDGELGYDLAGTFETPPQLGPLKIDDQPADESFTVYDHPKAFIFKKTRDLSDQEWWDALGDAWQGAIHGYIGKPTLLMKLRGAGDVPDASGSRADADKSTALSKPLDQWPVVDDWHWNGLANRNSAAAIFVWWLAVQGIGLLTFPMAFLLLRKLADGGYLLSKSFGVLLLSYGVWLPAGLGLPANRLSVIWLVLAILLAVNLIVAFRNRAALLAWWQKRWIFVLVGEGVFAFVFLLFVAFRLANPDLWQPWNGGEKMFEIGFLHAIVKSATMPPYDPFFAGTFINYYYYGLFIVGVLVKLTGITPVIAFNLAVPMLAALTAVNVFSLAGSLTAKDEGGRMKDEEGSFFPSSFILPPSSFVAGLLAVLIIIFFSNLDGMGQFLRNLSDISGSNFSSAVPGLETLVRGGVGFVKALGGASVREYNYWDVSRVIPNTINEFPYWSFLFADLHPHMIGIPFTVLFLALTFSQLKIQTCPEQSRRDVKFKMDSGLRNPFSTLNFVFFTAFVLGALAVINTWDLPTYLGILAAGVMIAVYRREEHPFTLRGGGRVLAKTALATLATLLLVMLLYRPFFAHYQTLDVGLGLVKDKIPLDEFLKLWGFFLLIIFTWLWVALLRPQTRFAPLRGISLFIRHWNVLPHLLEVYRTLVIRSTACYQNLLIGSALVLAFTLVLALLKLYTVALLLPWLAIAFLLLLRKETSAEQSFIELLTFTGLLLLLGVQLVFLRDFLGGGDYYRMNTYFKFFIQVWILFGVASAVMLVILWQRASAWRWYWRLTWQTAVFLLVLSSLVFLILGTRTRLNNRFPGLRPAQRSLNGMDYMTVGQFEWEGITYDLPYDYEAIKWLQNNVKGTPIIAEAKIGYYREWGMRVAAYTGLPSALGGLHQSEQHFPAELAQRDSLVTRFWFSYDEDETLRLLDELDIAYIYFGQLERALYGSGVEDTFNRLVERGELEIVFQNERIVIYRVILSRL